VFEKLLAEVVAERVDHEIRKMIVRLAEDHVAVSWIAIFQLLLQVTASVLILAEIEKLPLEILDANSSETVDCLSVAETQEQT
jgi:hypothetical protein